MGENILIDSGNEESEKKKKQKEEKKGPDFNQWGNPG